MKTKFKLWAAILLLICMVISLASYSQENQENQEPANKSYVKIKTMKIVGGDTIVTEKEYSGEGNMTIEDTTGGNSNSFQFRSFNGMPDSGFFNDLSHFQDMFKDFNFGSGNFLYKDFSSSDFLSPFNNFDVDSIIKQFNFRDADSLFPQLNDNRIIIKSYKDKDRPQQNNNDNGNNNSMPNMDWQLYGKNNQGQQVIFNKKITILDKGVNATKTSREDLNIEVFPNPADGLFNVSFELDPERATDIIITDINGKELLKETIDKATGNYTKQFDLTNYAKGNYMLSIKQGKKAASRQIIID